MDDLTAGSDLCEQNHFLRQARLLRAMAGAGGKVYLLVERGDEYNDNFYEVAEGDGEFRTLFLDRYDAELEATFRNARKLREIDLADFGYSVEDVSSLDEAELVARASAILGEPFRARVGGFWRPSLPKWATDDQMIALARLFDKLRFYHVIEAEFGG
jgi:hypothetical protein